MKKLTKISFCFKYILIISFFTFAIPLFSNAKTTRTFNFQGNKAAFSGGNGGETTLKKGTKYTFENTELVTINANTKSRSISVASHLMWMRWYGEKHIDGGGKTQTLGNNTNKTKVSNPITYRYSHGIDTTSDDFYFNYSQTGGDSNYSFNLQIDF